MSDRYLPELVLAIVALILILISFALGCARQFVEVGSVPSCHDGTCGTVEWVKVEDQKVEKPVIFLDDHGYVRWGPSQNVSIEVQ